MKLHLVIILFTVLPVLVFSQGNVHQQSTQYAWPDDPLVRAKLERWQDLKFGVIIHWGLYAVPGIIESWQLCSENWIERDSTSSYDKYKDWYWGLSKEFNPQQFDPEQWATAAHDAGMKYVVFTTKHHDGFNLFDTGETEFKITAGPFKNHPRSNVAKHVFEAFRKQQFMIGAYFSKPDWHSDYFWWPKYATPDRNVNYDINKYGWRWNQFKRFTFNQIGELMTGYGGIDILWLDGGWVRPLETVNDEVRSWGAAIPPWSQDVDMPSIAAMAHSKQPGILIVDRTVHGPFENYQTPEQRIPAHRINNPWESCITLGNAWGHVENDTYKSATTVIHTLAEVVAKGGNLLLGIGPSPQGTLNDRQIARLKEVGDWLRVHGDAIYGTRSLDVFQSGKTFFTGKADVVYAIHCIDESSQAPATVEWRGNLPVKGTVMKLVGSDAEVRWKIAGDKVTVNVPRRLVGKETPALVFEYKAIRH